MKVKVNTDLERLQLKAHEAFKFMEGHPAIDNVYSSLFECLFYSVNAVCKRGYSNDVVKSGVSVYNKGENAKRFKERFDKELKEYGDDDNGLYIKCPSLVNIIVPYTELFGEPWKFDHVEYWGELTLKIYNKESKEEHKPWRWVNWSGPNASGRTYEEMVINMAKALKKGYGNFGYYSFMSPKEIQNNKDERPFFFKDSTDFKGCSEMINNPKYISVTNEEKNIRWQEWMKKNKNKTFEF